MRILLRLMGGLGNQMFQHAAARSAALTQNASLQLDLRQLEGRSGHDTYGLDRFALDTPAAPSWRLPDMWKSASRFRPSWPEILRRYETLHHEGRDIVPLVGKTGQNLLLIGYFQSEAFFTDHADVIRDDFQLREPARPDVQRWLDRIAQSPNAVSVHYRRGDFIDRPDVNSVFAHCHESYYQFAVSHLNEHCGTPNLFVFTDDPDWARQNVRFDTPFEVVDCADRLSPHDDMRLMAACDHNIIANSTFSWWGGWLNDNPQKIVIAPDRWYLVPEMERPDQMPDAWIKLPTGDPRIQRPS